MNELSQLLLFAPKLIVIVLTGGIALSAVLGFVINVLGLFADVKEEKNTRRRLSRAVAIRLGLALVMMGVVTLLGLNLTPPLWDVDFDLPVVSPLVSITAVGIGLLLLHANTYRLGALAFCISLLGFMPVHLPADSSEIGTIAGYVLVMAIMWLATMHYLPDLFPAFVSNRFHKTQG